VISIILKDIFISDRKSQNRVLAVVHDMVDRIRVVSRVWGVSFDRWVLVYLKFLARYRLKRRIL
jgi:hypothetical protein